MSLRSPVWRNGALDGAAWAEQPLIWSERQRGRALYWPGGEDWFVNDPLGRIPHSHPDASELYLVVAGRLDLTVGRTQVNVGAGGYCFIPPDTFHDPHNPGPDDLCLFVIVAPNWRDRRWKTDGFVDADYASFPGLAETAAPGPLPGDESIRASVEELGAGDASEVAIRGNEDRTIYVLDGRAR